MSAIDARIGVVCLVVVTSALGAAAGAFGGVGTLDGNNNDNNIYGTVNRDTGDAQAGNDEVFADSGNDTARGGQDKDFVYGQVGMTTSMVGLTGTRARSGQALPA